MTTDNTGAPGAHVFDPKTWLAEFQRCGGYWIVTDGRLAGMGVYLDGNMDHEERACVALRALKRDPEQIEALRAYLAAEAGRA